uniref:Glycosyltransferase n=1 Tax=viral metagenome TaxID=1070528 RepID=A0A6C0DF82_9ZZZZ
MDYLPGNTLLPSEEHETTSLTPLSLPLDRPAIILASNEVNDQNLFINGLTQNIVVLYHLFESLGYDSYLLQHSTTYSDKKDFLKRYRSITTQDMVQRRISIRAFIEIGMSLDSATRGYLRTVGAKIVKLYLGNILNIDVETIQNYSNMFFNHHIVGEIDEIWTSPHYMQHVDYAALLNRTPIDKGRVVPYVWDSCFLTQYGNREQFEWIPPADWKTMDIIIMDPNISFQKCTFYSILLVEAYSKLHPEWRGNVHVINGDRLKLSSNSHNNLLPALSMYRANRIKLYERKKIHQILEQHRSACFLTHQWNNDYNYMTLELLYCNYPILHNSEGWAPYGYSYSINAWEKAIETLHGALTNHERNLHIYKTHAANLIWKHSSHNPDIQRRWRELI